MVGQEHVIRERQVEQQGGGQAEVTFAHGLEVRPGKKQRTYDISSVITSRMHDSMLLKPRFHAHTDSSAEACVQACCRNESNETEPGSREELHKLAFTVALAATLLPLPHTRQVEVSFLCAPMLRAVGGWILGTHWHPIMRGLQHKCIFNQQSQLRST